MAPSFRCRRRRRLAVPGPKPSFTASTRLTSAPEVPSWLWASTAYYMGRPRTAVLRPLARETALAVGWCSSGVVFELRPPVSPGGDWRYKVIYSFTGGSDGGNPDAFASGITVASDGTIYGTTRYAGSGPCTSLGNPNCCGVVYELMPPAAPGGAWQETVLHSFVGGSDGAFPLAAPIIGKSGELYGATSSGGSGACPGEGAFTACGTVYELTPPSAPGGTWTESVLYSFEGTLMPTPVRVNPRQERRVLRCSSRGRRRRLHVWLRFYLRTEAAGRAGRVLERDHPSPI
jgi:hypothetical protein